MIGCSNKAEIEKGRKAISYVTDELLGLNGAATGKFACSRHRREINLKIKLKNF